MSDFLSGSDESITHTGLGQNRIISSVTESLTDINMSHSNYVTSVAISSGGKHLVSGSGDKTVKIWDMSTGRLVNTLRGHGDSVESVAISSDGEYIVSGSRDTTVKVWDIGSGRVLDTLRGHDGTVWSVAISSDGEYIVSGSQDNFVKIWDISGYISTLVKNLVGHIGSVESVAISSGGEYIVSGSNDKTVKVWDMITGRLMYNSIDPESSQLCLAISPDGKYIVSGYKTIKIWDIGSGSVLYTLSHRVGVRVVGVRGVAISPDGKYIVTGSSDLTIKIWDMSTGECLKTLTGHTAALTSVAISSDGKYIVSGSYDFKIKIWNVAYEESTTLQRDNILQNNNLPRGMPDSDRNTNSDDEQLLQNNASPVTIRQPMIFEDDYIFETTDMIKNINRVREEIIKTNEGFRENLNEDISAEKNINFNNTKNVQEMWDSFEISDFSKTWNCNIEGDGGMIGDDGGMIGDDRVDWGGPTKIVISTLLSKYAFYSLESLQSLVDFENIKLRTLEEEKNLDIREELKSQLSNMLYNVTQIVKNTDKYPFILKENILNLNNRSNVEKLSHLLKKVLFHKIKYWQQEHGGYVMKFTNIGFKMNYKIAMKIVCKLRGVNKLNDETKFAILLLDNDIIKEFLDTYLDKKQGFYDERIKHFNKYYDEIDVVASAFEEKNKIVSPGDIMKVFSCDAEFDKLRLVGRIENFGFSEEFKEKLIKVVLDLTKDQFEKLMKFITGGNCYSDDIKFQLIEGDKFNAHTCSNTLDIPRIVIKKSYEELRDIFGGL